MNEWNTVTARHRPAGTQGPTTNRYQGLADDTADDQTMASANSVMSDIGEARYRQYHSKSVKDYIAKADLKPMVGNVTSIDVTTSARQSHRHYPRSNPGTPGKWPCMQGTHSLWNPN